MKRKKRSIETDMIHNEYQTGENKGSLSFPIFQTSTFSFGSAAEGARRFAGEEEGYIYTRLGNPTVRALEERIAVLEGADKGLAFASGMAAVSAVLIALTKSGDHVLCSNGLYGCTYGLLQMLEEKYRVTHDFSYMQTEQEIHEKITPETSCIFVETPINPTMKVIDLTMVAKVAEGYGIPVVVDNTFCTPYLQKPLDLGCDIVIHSATKYIGGHGDVIAGLVAGSDEFISALALSQQKDIGGVLSPFDAWLLLRGMKTLHVRMDRHSSNAQEIAERLNNHPRIRQVFYPGLPQHEHCSIVQRQMKDSGGVIAFELDGDQKDAQKFMDQLKLIKIAVSLGDAETLIQHPATMTHAVVPEDKRREMGISNRLVRLSAGLEAVEDLWEDLNQALEK
ncbi:methionine gamma-lyase [Halobacillus litoralis]|uniref:methionine gamma-lyase n=1 Tax=Halobacillus litoralis TaxID=45668 RepID=UPI001CFD256C|nr:methionine gamma-lyase [Halobacillus litoralis]